MYERANFYFLGTIDTHPGCGINIVCRVEQLDQLSSLAPHSRFLSSGVISTATSCGDDLLRKLRTITNTTATITAPPNRAANTMIRMSFFCSFLFSCSISTPSSVTPASCFEENQSIVFINNMFRLFKNNSAFTCSFFK